MPAPVPFCSVTPMQPAGTGYNPSSPGSPYGLAALFTYGGDTRFGTFYSLCAQGDLDQIVLKGDHVPLGDHTVQTFDQLRRGCAVYIDMSGRNVTTDYQYLFLFSLQGTGSVQIFLGTQWLQTEQLSAQGDTIAILMDCPGERAVRLFLRLASDEQHAEMVFKGMDCYLL